MTIYIVNLHLNKTNKNYIKLNVKKLHFSGFYDITDLFIIIVIIVKKEKKLSESTTLKKEGKEEEKKDKSSLM